MLKASALATVLAGLTLAGAAQADIQIDLGSTQRVTQLFAYPNNCNVICFQNWTLEQTVEHYLNQSLQRDGYTNATLKVTVDNQQVFATLKGVPDNYDQPLIQLLNAGDLAYKGASQLLADKKWAYNWYLFLPLGMALENRRSVELLHFPPDYSLTQAQDYLKSNTTDRWAELLTTNGVAAAQTPGYQTIIDIAPIAAPATAGSDLEGTYSYFNDYQTTMVKQVSQSLAGQTLPMVAFGAPVRNWIKTQYGPTVSVLGLATISPVPGKNVPVLGANHPSYIWYAADPANHDNNQAQADAAGVKVMGQDLTAACWQAGMGGNPKADPKATLSACTQKWQVTDKLQSCELFYTTIRKDTPEQAQALCSAAKSLKAPATLPPSPL
ncbi:hypothetical protein [Pseudomonas sp. TE3610]